MASGKYDITCEQGASFVRILHIYNADETLRDLTDYTARMHVRRKQSSASTLIELTTENGGIIIDPNGMIQLVISASATTVITDDGVYDLELVAPNGDVERIIQGNFILDREVTR